MKIVEFLGRAVPDEAMVFVVSGAEAFLREQAVERIVAAQPEGIEVEVLRGPASATESQRLALSDLLDELRMGSLFGQQRLIHLRSADVFVKEHAKPLTRFVGGGEAVHRLILEGDALVPRASKAPRGLLKAVLDSGGVHVQCDPLFATPFQGRGPVWQSPLSRWVQERARGFGKRMSLEAAYFLHHSAGTGLRELDGELRKLALFVGERPAIGEDDIQRVVGAGRLAPVFDLADAIAGRDVRQALEQGSMLFERGLRDFSGRFVGQEDAIAMTILATVSSKMRKVARACELMAHGATLAEAASAIKHPHFLIDRLRTQVEAWRAPGTMDRLTRALLELERGLKTGLGSPRVQWDRFVVEGLGAKSGRLPWAR